MGRFFSRARSPHPSSSSRVHDSAKRGVTAKRSFGRSSFASARASSSTRFVVTGRYAPSSISGGPIHAWTPTSSAALKQASTESGHAEV